MGKDLLRALSRIHRYKGFISRHWTDIPAFGSGLQNCYEESITHSSEVVAID